MFNVEKIVVNFLLRLIKFYVDDDDVDSQLDALVTLSPNQLKHFLQHSAYFEENVPSDVGSDVEWTYYSCYTTREDRIKLLIAYKTAHAKEIGGLVRVFTRRTDAIAETHRASKLGKLRHVVKEDDSVNRVINDRFGISAATILDFIFKSRCLHLKEMAQQCTIMDTFTDKH